MPYKHFWAGVDVVLGPFKGGGATNKTKNVPHKPLWRGYYVELTDEIQIVPQILHTTLRKFPQSSTTFLPFCPPERSLPAIIKQGDRKNPRKRGLPAR